MVDTGVVFSTMPQNLGAAIEVDLANVFGGDVF
jgi:hypothetical protein